MDGSAQVKWLIALLALAIAVPTAAQEGEHMLIIAHRGASGERPEHTLAAYELAIDQGADYIEPDLVPTRDGVLVARHENEIGGTTDVAQHPEFASRLTTRTIDGVEVTGWFTEDFTLAELRTLRARERLPELRPQNTAYDGLYQVPTLEEIIALVRAREAETGRRIGLYPELKHPHYFAGIGQDTAETLVEQLNAAGYTGEDAPVFIQSFEMDVLQRLNGVTDLRLVQLISAEGGPADRRDWLYADMITPQGLADLAEYADAVGVDIRLLLASDERDGELRASSTGLTEAAQAAGLLVHAWTARRENAFLPQRWWRPRTPSDEGCDNKLYRSLVRVGVDGVFSDNPERAVTFTNLDNVMTGWCADD
ncbi:MAG: glycerophosphodiester phosphodiesterase [Erythrobacter sp.]|nr:glycerophosphodiester phosphodiesterase [Erythrobacter sp.]